VVIFSLNITKTFSKSVDCYCRHTLIKSTSL